MAEFKEGQGVKTHRDNDHSGKIVDGASGATATHLLSVVEDGDAKSTANDYGIPMMVEKEDGTYCVPAADDGCSLKVVVVDEVDDSRQHSHATHSGVTALGGTDDHDSAVIPSGDIVNEIEFVASSPGCFKYEIGEYDGVSVFTVHAVVITQPASPTLCCKVCLPDVTGDGSVVLRVRATNNDDTDNDAFSTMCYKTRTP